MATGRRKMTKYLGGKGIMPGKGTKLPAGLFKGRDASSQAKTRNCFRRRTYHVQKQRDKKWNGLVRMQDARFHLPHTCTLCSQCQPGSPYICHHLPQGPPCCPQITVPVLGPSTLPHPRPLFYTYIFLQTSNIFSPVLELS